MSFGSKTICKEEQQRRYENVYIRKKMSGTEHTENCVSADSESNNIGASTVAKPKRSGEKAARRLRLKKITNNQFTCVLKMEFFPI